jgi:hypothetical protein
MVSMSNVLNPKSTPGIANPSSPMNPARPDSQGGITSPESFKNLPPSRHPALQIPAAGNPVRTPLMPTKPRG